jgi:hypothetical protein
MMNKQEHYYEMWDKLQAGQISEEVWREYCREVLEEILWEPEVRAVMERLKHR